MELVELIAEAIDEELDSRIAAESALATLEGKGYRIVGPGEGVEIPKLPQAGGITVGPYPSEEGDGSFWMHGLEPGAYLLIPRE